MGVPWGEDFCPIFARSWIDRPFVGPCEPEDGREPPVIVRVLAAWGSRGRPTGLESRAWAVRGPVHPPHRLGVR